MTISKEMMDEMWADVAGKSGGTRKDFERFVRFMVRKFGPPVRFETGELGWKGIYVKKPVIPKGFG